MKKILLATTLLLGLVACVPEADVASHNLSKDADNFKIDRRIVFYNGITDTYMLTLEGRCSLGNNDSAGQLTVTCKTGPDAFKKHFLGLSDNVTYFVEQLEPADVSVYHYKVTFRPHLKWSASTDDGSMSEYQIVGRLRAPLPNPAVLEEAACEIERLNQRCAILTQMLRDVGRDVEKAEGLLKELEA